MMKNQPAVVKETKLYGHIVTAQDLGRKGLEGKKVGDAVIFGIAQTDEQALCFQVQKFDIHAVTEAEAGKGQFAGAEAGTVGIIDDGKFLSVAELNVDIAQQVRLLGQADDPVELTEDDLDLVVGGKIRWNTRKFFRCLGVIIGGICTGGAGFALTAAIDVGVSASSAIVHGSKALHSGDYDKGMKEIKEDYLGLLPFDV